MREKILRITNNNLDKMLAIGGIVIGTIAAFVLRIIAPAYLSTGIMLVIACALYLLLSRRREVSWEQETSSLFPAHFNLVLNIMFLMLLSYIILLLYYSTGERPPGFFVAIALMSVLIILEVAATPPNAKGRFVLILIKILVIALILRWSLFYMYPGSYLGTDPWRNAVVFDQIINAGHLLPEVGGYYHMPVQHLLVSATNQLTGMAVRESMILSIGLFEIISLVFIYLLGRQIFNTKIGLVAALLLGVSNLHITWGWWLVAQTAGIALVTFLIFMIFTPRTQAVGRYRLFTFMLLIMLILTHSVSSFVGLVLLILAFVAGVIYTSISGNKSLYSLRNITIFYAVALLGYWIYISNFLPEYVRMVWGMAPEMSVSIAYTSTVTSTINPLWAEMNRLGNLLFYGLSAIGILFMLNKKNISLSRFSLAFGGITLTVLIYLIFLFLDIEVMIGRWFVFMDIMLAIPAAMGLVFMVNSIEAKWAKLSMLAIIPFILTFLMITNASTSFDSPIYPDYLKNRSALSESELTSADTIASVYEGALAMDYTHRLALEDRPEVSVVSISNPDIQNNLMDFQGILLLRRYIVDNVFIAWSHEGIFRTELTYDPYQVLEYNRYNRVYDDGGVTAYLPGE